MLVKLKTGFSAFLSKPVFNLTQSQYFNCDYNKLLTLILPHGKLPNNINEVTFLPMEAAPE
ncbi:hypothetical protein IO98_16710 [Lacrimispora celerecrescens]|uniref:Uncharacterized protein n=1 Tax=Lacrimispora celerecrescens TaxID=29354 RepID=A0A084JJF7_9FIRM|nr:hypothetical protein IO98_16710 [Lacrimispora celerecrescens]